VPAHEIFGARMLDTTYERRLPHWRRPGATYFVTWRLHREQHRLWPCERDLIVTVLRHFEGSRFRLTAYVVMDDHVHVVVTPALTHPLTSIVRGWKGYSAHSLQRCSGRCGRVWQAESYDHIVRDATALEAIVSYVLDNPRKRRPGLDRYDWLWYE
jgi:REP element-mobilizing transposase RayT